MSLLARLNAGIGEVEDANDTIPYFLPTPLPNINMVLSDRIDGGFAGGRITTIFGPESSGKTALATQTMVRAQAMGGFAAFMDHEHAFQLPHGIRQGLREDAFYYRKPMSAEQSFGMVYQVMQLVRCEQTGYDFSKIAKEGGHVKFLEAMKKYGVEKLPPLVEVIDSIASMIPQAQDVAYADQNMKTANMSLAALLSIELKRLTRDANTLGATMILLNQIRDNPGIMFGEKSGETGGKALKFYASTRVQLRKAGKVYADWGDNTTEQVGDVVEMITVKNKVARPGRKTKYIFRTDNPVGLDLAATMVYLGKEAGVLGAVTGKSIEFGGKKQWGINAFLAESRTNPALVSDITKHVMPAIMPSLRVEVPVAAEEEAA